MRSICEKAIIHLLNDETDLAESLFKEFMVKRARQIHESLRQGEEVALTEGWDDEITEEEYFTEDDLTDLEDDGSSPDTVADASADVADDMGADASMGDAMDADADASADMTDASDESDAGDSVDARLDDVEAQIEALTAEWEAKMAELDGDEDGTDGDDMGMDDEAGDVEDDASTDSDELADQMTNDMGEEATAAADDSGEHEDPTLAEAEEDEFADDNLDDITESVIDELERISVDMTSSKEVGAGKSVKVDNRSIIPGNSSDRKGGSPVVIKSKDYVGYDREGSPVVKPNPVKSAKNVRKDAFDGVEKVPAMGPKGAILNSDFAPIKKTQSTLTGVANKS